MTGSFFDRLFGRKPPQDEPAPREGLMDAAVYEKALADTQAAIDRHWAAVGQLESDVIGNFISPSFLGRPSWPTTRQAYRVVRRGRSILLATDGMSDPYEDDDAENGFGMELFIETADIPAELAGAPGDIGRLQDSWAFDLLEDIAETVAGHGGVRTPLDGMGCLSMESPGVSQSRAIPAQVPARFITPDDSIGVLIGLPKPNFHDQVKDTPFRPVLLAPVVLLTAEELGYVRTGGAEARKTVAERLARSETGCRSSLTRPSVV